MVRKTYKQLILINLTLAGLCRMTFGDVAGTEVGLGSELDKLIAKDTEVMLFAVQDVTDNLTRAYTISRQKFNQIKNSKLRLEEGSDKVDLHKIAKNCREYIRQSQKSSRETNEYELVSMEIRSRRIEGVDVWYARASFTRQSGDWFQSMKRGSDLLGAFALLDGEVLKPRITEYTRYIDREMDKWMHQNSGPKPTRR